VEVKLLLALAHLFSLRTSASPPFLYAQAPAKKVEEDDDEDEDDDDDEVGFTLPRVNGCLAHHLFPRFTCFSRLTSQSGQQVRLLVFHATAADGWASASLGR